MSFKEAHLDSQSVPRSREVPVAVTDPVQSFEIGALGTLVDEEFVEATSPDPDTVTHVAQAPYGVPTVAPTFDGFGLIGNQRGFPPGRVVVSEAAEVKYYRAQFLGDLPADRGGLYGVEKDVDGLWKVNFATVVGDLVVKYIRPIDPGTSEFTVREVIVEIVQPAVTVV